MKKQFLIEVEIPSWMLVKDFKQRIKRNHNPFDLKFLPLPKPVNYFEEKRKREQGKY